MKRTALLSVFICCIIFTHAQIKADPHGKIKRLHYFYNSGWLLETPDHILVFDFIPHYPSGITFSTLEEQIERSGKNKDILVLITHDHNDHFNDSIFRLATRYPTIRFILGWKPAGQLHEKSSVLAPGDSLAASTYTVFAHTASDEGSGFLVKTDGLSIYHAGDHALWVDDIADMFTGQLKFIRSKTTAIDIAFLPAARGLFVNCTYDGVIAKGLQLSVSLLSPRIIALQHIGCADKLGQYKLARADIARPGTAWVVPEQFNQEF